MKKGECGTGPRPDADPLRLGRGPNLSPGEVGTKRIGTE